MLRDYVKHLAVATPVEGLAISLRDIADRFNLNLQRHPELREIYIEDRYIAQALKQLITPEMNCIDIGAHLGSMTSKFKRLAPKGHHTAVEAIPYKYQWLKQKFPDVELWQLAITNYTGTVEFVIKPNESGFSGMKLHGEPNTRIERIEVKCARLDDLIPRDRPIGFLKVDVEGAELSVFEGAEQLLQRCHPTLLFECTMSGLTTYNLTPKEMWSYLHGHHGYNLFTAKSWLAGDSPLSYEALEQAMQYPFQAFNFLAIAPT